MQQSNNICRYDAINGLRTFSAIGILLMHVNANTKYFDDTFVFSKLIPSFTNLVFLFMTVSGFVMCCGYYDKIINNKISIGQFYKKRFIKIWPFFAMLCLMDFIVSPSINSFYEVFANLTLCFGLLPDSMLSVIGVGWFVGLIFVFYMVFPFFCYLISNKKRAWFSFFIALLFNLLCSGYFDIGRNNIMYSAVFFFAGGLIFIYRDKLQYISDKYRYFILAACILATTIYYIIDSSIPSYVILSSLFLIYAIGDKKRKILDNKITEFLSNISMEIYLCHMFVFRIIEKIGIKHPFKSDILSFIFISILTILGAITFSYISQKIINFITNKISKFCKSKNEGITI